jgi:hypothetical protein
MLLQEMTALTKQSYNRTHAYCGKLCYIAVTQSDRNKLPTNYTTSSLHRRNANILEERWQDGSIKLLRIVCMSTYIPTIP